MLGAGLFGALAWLFWPTGPQSDWQQYPLAGACALVVASGLARAGSGLHRDYRLRRLRASAAQPSGVLGKARFAQFHEREAAGLHDPNGTMLLGEADGMPLFLPKGHHLSVCAPPGAGKTSSLVIGAVFHAAMTGRSVVVQDVKPEMAHVWASVLEEKGFRVRFFNPGRIAAFGSHDTNPFAPIIEAVQDPAREAEAFTLAESQGHALLPEGKESKDAFWRDGERSLLVAMLLCLAVFEPENCRPAKLWAALTDPERCLDLLLDAKNSDALGGDLKIVASSFLAKDKDNPEHFESHRSGAANALSVFKPSSLLGRVGADHDFDVRDLRDESQPPVVLFDLITNDQIAVFGKANALIQTSRLQALRRHRHGRDVVFLADEATNLPIPSVVQDMELMRSFGITLALFYQSFASLKRVYGEERANSIRTSSVEVYFSVADLPSADEISKRIGDHTVKTRSIGFSGRRGEMPNETVSEAGKRLLAPEDILAMNRDDALVLMPGQRPVLARKLPWFQVAPYQTLAGDNPNEPGRPRAPARLSLRYAKTADRLGAPKIEGEKQRRSRALAGEAVAAKPSRVPWLRGRSFLWAPILAGLALGVHQLGTPHLIYEYQTRADLYGERRCTFIGIGGFRTERLSRPCPTVTLIRHWDR